MRQISQTGISLIKSFEGCRLKAYKPVPTEKYWTIGWGHYGSDITEGMTITQAQADAMFLKDIQRYVAPVNNPNYVTITAQLTQNQFDALVSFCYNCGAGNLQKLCKGTTAEQIAKSLPLYNRGGGQVLKGLVRRRAAELALFNKADVTEPVKQPVKQEESEDDVPMKLEAWQKTLITSEVTAWSKVEVDGEPVINSPQVWIDKVNKGTLTAGELATLTFAIVSRAVKK